MRSILSILTNVLPRLNPSATDGDTASSASSSTPKMRPKFIDDSEGVIRDIDSEAKKSNDTNFELFFYQPTNEKIDVCTMDKAGLEAVATLVTDENFVEKICGSTDGN